ncbi:MAG: phycobilisome protein, partial [Alkalinema sp. RL_2_19]|nr:phycobilisome protein [Alkalinema sp. RL_2_19]
MLSQMQRLTTATEGRYATDEELRFLPEYLRSYELRMQTYQQLQ